MDSPRFINSSPDELKQQLLSYLKSENESLSSIAQSFFEKSHVTELDKKALLQAIIQSTTHIIESGDWESSLFLRNQIKKIRDIQAEAQEALSQLEKTTLSNIMQMPSLEKDERDVYVSLFQSDGYNFSGWEVQLRSLNRYLVGRPVYANESDIQKRMRLRGSLANEAYVILAVKKNEIKTEFLSNQMKDQFGQPLLQITDAGIARCRIRAFVHMAQPYFFHEGRLIKM